MSTVLERDRLRELVDLVVRSMDEDEVNGAVLASRGCLSRFHFDRLMSAALRESPAAFRRRLLLERAAWQLSNSAASITSIALASNYRSVEGFTRAFLRSFGSTPGRYRRAPSDFRIRAPNGIHFHPPGGLYVPGPTDRRKQMDFVDRVVTHDIWQTGRFIDLAEQLPVEDLDRPLFTGWDSVWYGNGEATLRLMLNEMVSNKENWASVLRGRPAPEERDMSLDHMRARLDTAGRDFLGVVRRIRDRGEWDSGFVDALCDPPESFTYGGMLAHVVTFSAFRRTMTVLGFRELGVDIGLGDPIEWERSFDAATAAGPGCEPLA